MAPLHSERSLNWRGLILTPLGHTGLWQEESIVNLRRKWKSES